MMVLARAQFLIFLRSHSQVLKKPTLSIALTTWRARAHPSFITYPDVVYKVATDAILIQTRCVQYVASLAKGPLLYFYIWRAPYQSIRAMEVQLDFFY